MPFDEDPPMTVEDQAADWIVRHDEDGLNAQEQCDFAAWMADPAHRVAYDRHRAVWMRYQAMGGMAPVAVPIIPAVRRRGGLGVSMMAACAALVVAGYLGDWPTRLRADYVTGVGERREITLADGSLVSLDGRSALAFDRADGMRRVRLLKGAALFKVAPDRAHPFVVDTGGGSVTALGTAFALRKQGDAADLVVTEHSVAVRTAQGADAVVHEGEGARFAPDGVSAVEPVDSAAATAWTRGKLIVAGRPLGEVVARIGRGRVGYWTVRGDAAALKVNGVFDLDRPEAALATLEKTFRLRSFRVSDRFVILSR